MQTMVRLAAASADAKAAGAEVVGGVQTTRYIGTYSATYAGQSGLAPMERKQLEEIFGMGALTFDIWVDNGHLPHRIQLKSGPGGKETTAITLTLRDLNKPVTITAPPVDQIDKPPPEFLGWPSYALRPRASRSRGTRRWSVVHAHQSNAERAMRNPISSILRVGWLRRRTEARQLQCSSYQPPPRSTR